MIVTILSIVLRFDVAAFRALFVYYDYRMKSLLLDSHLSAIYYVFIVAYKRTIKKQQKPAVYCAFIAILPRGLLPFIPGLLRLGFIGRAGPLQHHILTHAPLVVE